MVTFTGRAFRRVILRGRREPRRARTGGREREELEDISEAPLVEVAPDDPIIGYFQSVSGVVDVDSLDLESPAVEALKAAGVKIVVPLVAQGELIGLLNLGPRRSEQEYSGDDRKLLANLAAQAAPAVRVGQLVREQEAEVRTRERIEQELRVAHLIQQQFLPKQLPELGGWQVSAYYRPARQVGGDFYDFIDLPDERVAIVVGDVTDKGVPAALVMASARSILRGEAARLLSPAKVLERANDLLVPDIPAQMFVTCLYLVLDPASGRIQYANAGHNLPYVRTQEGVVELRATGMPLGLMEGMTYDEKEAVIGPGENMLLSSDGVVEAHNPEREMFGFPRLMKLMENAPKKDGLIDFLLTELDSFTGSGWEQEDDITLVTVERASGAGVRSGGLVTGESNPAAEDSARLLEEFSLPSEMGNERIAMERVTKAVEELELSGDRLDRLRTAVAEATMNAIEHGNKNQAELPVSVRVVLSDSDLRVQITDEGGDREIPEPETPDLEAKLAGLQQPRGWGLFLIKNMVDEMQIRTDERHHTVELIVHLKGEGDGN